jgi:lipopolysaccharide exporter
VEFRRDFRFEAAFALAVRAKVISLLVTLAVAAWTRSYWALAVGIVVNQAAITLFSYTMHPYRPRLSLNRRQEIYGFSLWTLLRSLGIYLTSQVDQFAVGGFAGASIVGRYAVALDVASSPTTEIHEPVVGVLYPVFSKSQDDRRMLCSMFQRIFGWSMITCAATGAGLSAIAPDYCLVLLGPQWAGVAPLIPVLAVAASLICISSATDPLFDTLGMPRWSALLQWVRLLILAGSIALAATMWRNIAAIAFARLAVSVVSAPAILMGAAAAAGLDARSYLPLLWRPILSAFLMAGLVSALRTLLPPSPLVRLLIEIPFGACTYGGSLLMLWWAAKRPVGPESELIAIIRKHCVSLREKWMVRAQSL